MFRAKTCYYTEMVQKKITGITTHTSTHREQKMKQTGQHPYNASWERVDDMPGTIFILAVFW